MHFFSFRMTDEVRCAYTDARHRYLLFGHTRERASDGTCICVIVGSGNDKEKLMAVAVDHAQRIDTHGRMTHYFIYPTESIEQGITLGSQEARAGDN